MTQQKWDNIHIIRAAEWEKNESGAKRVFEETMAENTQIWWKTHVQI